MTTSPRSALRAPRKEQVQWSARSRRRGDVCAFSDRGQQVLIHQLVFSSVSFVLPSLRICCSRSITRPHVLTRALGVLPRGILLSVALAQKSRPSKTFQLIFEPYSRSPDLLFPSPFFLGLVCVERVAFCQAQSGLWLYACISPLLIMLNEEQYPSPP